MKIKIKWFLYKLGQRFLYIFGCICKEELKKRFKDKRHEYGFTEETPPLDRSANVTLKGCESRSYYYTQLRPEMMDFIKGKPQKILEIGCGAGLFRRNFAKDIEYWGVEPFETAAEEARKHLSEILIGTYDETKDKIPANYFDLIICNDVIEHMPDPKAFLNDIRSKLTVGGSMIVSVPNLRNAQNLWELLVKGDFKYEDCGVLDYTHFHLFTKLSLVNMAEECGWDVDTYHPINEIDFPRCAKYMLLLLRRFIPEIRSYQIAARLTPKCED